MSSREDIYNEYDTKISEWIEAILKNPKNLASETELREQGKVALNYFIEYDIDQTNTLTFNELKLLCDQLGLPVEKDEEEMLFKLDQDGSGALDLFEFISWWLKRISTLPNPMKQQEAIAKYTFGKFDADHSGFLDHQELKNLIDALGAQFTDEEIDQAIQEIDADGSGVIECSEFILWWTNRVMNNRQSSSMISLKLKKLAAKANQMFATDIFTAAWKNDRELLFAFLEGEERLLQASDENDYGDGWTILHYLCYRGYYDLLALLLEKYPKKVNINCTNNDGFTPLFYAAQQGHSEIIQLLLEHEADPCLFGRCEITTFDQESEASQSSVQFMSPVEFVLDYPKMKPLFLKHQKCRAPKALTANDFQVSLSRSQETVYHLTLTLLAPLKTLSFLPIRSYRLSLAWMNASYFFQLQEANYLVPNLSKLCSLMAPSLLESTVLTIPAIDPSNLNSYQSSTLSNLLLEIPMIQCLQILYYSTFLVDGGEVEVPVETKEKYSSIEIAMGFLRTLSQCYDQYLTKIMTLTQSFQSNNKKGGGVGSLSSCLSLDVEKGFHRLWQRLFQHPSLSSEGEDLRNQLTVLYNRLQELLEAKKEAIAKQLAKAKGESKQSGGEDLKAGPGRSLTLEELKSCVEGLLASPPAPAPAPVENNIATIAETKEESKDPKDKSVTRSKPVQKGGDKRNSSVIVGKDQFRLINHLPAMTFAVTLISNNILFDSDPSEAKNFSLSFPVSLS